MLYIIMKGRNEDDFFIQANRLINMYEANELIDDIDWNVVDILYWEDNGSGKMGISNVIRNMQKSFCQKCSLFADLKHLEQLIASGLEYMYYLQITNKQVDSSGEEIFDIIPLRYFSIMRRKYKDKIFLGIENNDISNSQRVSGYMFIDNLVEMNLWGCQLKIEEKNNKQKRCYIIGPEYLNENKLYNQMLILQTDARKQSRLIIHGIEGLNKIIPCINLDWIWYDIFVDIVGNSYDSFVVCEEGDDTDLPVRKDYIYKLQKECSGKKKSREHKGHFYNDMSKEEWKRILYEVIIKDICLDNLWDGKLLDSADSKQLYAKCQNMSLLSFLLFSAFSHFIYVTTKKELTDVYINNLILSAQDFADGLIQLIENVLENAEQGCFSFRI